MQKKKEVKNIEIEKLSKELQEEKELKLGLMADFENFRKRVESEKAKFGAIANMAIIKQIMEILDDIQLAENDKQADLRRYQEVMQILKDKLIAALLTSGVEKLSIASGDKFDPTTMEAITSVPSNENMEDNCVVEVVSQAYKYAGEDTLLKTAKVIVAKGTA